MTAGRRGANIGPRWPLVSHPMNSFLADVVVAVHCVVVLFMVLGLAAILVGWPLKWRWIRNRWFRLVHLAIMGYITFNALRGELCFLTLWERDLRARAGQYTADDISFVGRLFRDVVYVDVAQAKLDRFYLVFGALVLVSIVFVRPNLRRRKAGTDARE